MPAYWAGTESRLLVSKHQECGEQFLAGTLRMMQRPASPFGSAPATGTVSPEHRRFGAAQGRLRHGQRVRPATRECPAAYNTSYHFQKSGPSPAARRRFGLRAFRSRLLLRGGPAPCADPVRATPRTRLTAATGGIRTHTRLSPCSSHSRELPNSPAHTADILSYCTAEALRPLEDTRHEGAPASSQVRSLRHPAFSDFVRRRRRLSARLRNARLGLVKLLRLVLTKGIEPLASCLPCTRSTD